MSQKLEELLFTLRLSVTHVYKTIFTIIMFVKVDQQTSNIFKDSSMEKFDLPVQVLSHSYWMFQLN